MGVYGRSKAAKAGSPERAERERLPTRLDLGVRKGGRDFPMLDMKAVLNQRGNARGMLKIVMKKKTLWGGGEREAGRGESEGGGGEGRAL